MIPANTSTFHDDLENLRNPKEGVIRTPINWTTPLEKYSQDGDHLEQATTQSYKIMMSHIKIAQKICSDRHMTNSIKELNDKEKLIWNVAELVNLKAIVDNYSQIEVINAYPDYTSVNKDGKLEFDISKFKSLLTSKDKGKSIFIDEYGIEHRAKEKELAQNQLNKMEKIIEENKEKLISECVDKQELIDLDKDILKIEESDNTKDWESVK